jgi:hypothetical protein
MARATIRAKTRKEMSLIEAQRTRELQNEKTERVLEMRMIVGIDETAATTTAKMIVAIAVMTIAMTMTEIVEIVTEPVETMMIVESGAIVTMIGETVETGETVVTMMTRMIAEIDVTETGVTAIVEMKMIAGTQTGLQSRRPRDRMIFQEAVHQTNPR